MSLVSRPVQVDPMALADVERLIAHLPSALIDRNARPKDVFLAAQRVLTLHEESSHYDVLSLADRRTLLMRLMIAAVRVHRLIEDAEHGTNRWSAQDRYDMDSSRLFHDIAEELGMSPQELQQI